MSRLDSEVPHECFAEKGASNSSSATTVLFVARSFPSQPPTPPQTRQNPRSGNPPAVLAPVFDLVLLRVHRQTPASRRCIALRTFLYGLSFTALVIGRTSDRNLFSFLSLLVLASILSATVAVCYESSEWVSDHLYTIIYVDVV
jgi:hypothetical protein